MICEFEFANRISLIWHRSLKRWEYGARNVGSRPRLVQWNYYRHSRNSRLIGLGLARARGLILCDARLSHIIITAISLRPLQEVSKSRLRTPYSSPIKKNLLSRLKYLVLDVEHSIILVEIIQNSLENQNKHELTLHACLPSHPRKWHNLTERKHSATFSRTMFRASPFSQFSSRVYTENIVTRFNPQF